MRALITSVPGGKIQFWVDPPDFGATAVFEVIIDYQASEENGQQRSKLVIDSMDFVESLWDNQGNLHGRLIKVKSVDDDMNGSVYFLSTHTPIHVKKIAVRDHHDSNIVQVELHYRLLFDQSGLADDVQTMITANLEVVIEF